MSYYVIKGPAENGNYLGEVPEHKAPQWLGRDRARRFADRESAWRWLDAMQKKHPDAWYQGRVVRVNTVRDWHYERARLRAAAEEWRMIADHQDREIKALRAGSK